MTAPAISPPTARTGTRLLRARWRSIVATTLVVVAAAAAVSALQPRTYEATAEVVVLPVVVTNGPAPQTPAMGTEKGLVTSGIVAAPVAQRLGLPVERLIDAVTVTVPPQTTTLQITCAQPDAAAAARCAQTLAQAYVQYKDTQPIATLPERGRIVSGAVPPPSPTVPNWWLNLLAGLLVGLVLGVLVALLRDRSDRRCRTAEDLERRGLRVLGVVPPAGAADNGAGGDTAREYGVLAARLRTAARPLGEASPVVVVTALGEAGGRARSVAAALAAALASAGDRVLLVHADTTGGGDDGPAGRPGLFDVLTGRADLDAATTRTAHPHLTRLGLGHRPGTRIALRDWSSTAAALAARYDAVVVAADPVGATANGLAVAQRGSAVLVVADARDATRDAVDALVDESGRLALPLVGAVLVRPGAPVTRSSSGDWSRWTDDTPAHDGAGDAGREHARDDAREHRRDAATDATDTAATTPVLRAGAPPNGTSAHPLPPA